MNTVVTTMYIWVCIKYCIKVDLKKLEPILRESPYFGVVFISTVKENEDLYLLFYTFADLHLKSLSVLLIA